MATVRSLLFLVILAAPSLAIAADATDWPQWRGPNRDGVIAGPKWPERLTDANFRQQWRVELGPSYSGPIVVGNRVFTTETVKAKTEIVRAYDRQTGAELWKAEWEGSLSVPFFAWANGSWIRATPACDEKHLFVAGMRDVLVALNVEDGKEAWRIDFAAQLKAPLPAFGFVSSPLLVGEHLYVQAGGAFCKVEKATGKIVWSVLKDGGGMYGSAFSSPVLASLQGKPQILVQTRQKLAGIDPENGGELWSQEIEATRGMNILTPTLWKESIFTSAHGGRSHFFQITKQGDKFTASEAWDNKLQAYMSSPIVIDGHAYLHLKSQRFACLDLTTGRETWTSVPFGSYWSMVAQGDRILALDERGELRLIHANPAKLEILDTRKVSDNSWGHLAVSGDQVFVRELKALAAYQWNELKK